MKRKLQRKFEHECKRKMPNREIEIKMGTTGEERCHRRKNMGII
jgi:hypothetical protein